MPELNVLCRDRRLQRAERPAADEAHQGRDRAGEHRSATASRACAGHLIGPQEYRRRRRGDSNPRPHHYERFRCVHGGGLGDQFAVTSEDSGPDWDGTGRAERPKNAPRRARAPVCRSPRCLAGWGAAAGDQLFRSAADGDAPFQNRSCCRPSTLTPKRRARRMRDHVSELRDGQNDSRGGSSETDVSELTIRPVGSPSGAAVMNATPVANLAECVAERARVGRWPRRELGLRASSQCSDVCSPRATWAR